MHLLKNLLFAVLVFYLPAGMAQTVPTVEAASDLKFALEEIAANYKTDKGRDLKMVFGSSGVLWQQIKNGAPFAMFLSADETYIDDLQKNGITLDGGSLYAIGRIVLLGKKNSPIKLSPDKDSMMKAIQSAKKIAIANPDHAPYGRAAKEFLMSMGVWDLIEPKLVFGENISQATIFALTGSADFAISALSLATAPVIKSQANYVLIPDQLHKPLKQKMVLIKNHAPSAMDFYQYLQEPKSKQIMTRYGFLVPQ
jgi:molybdate transport system substrate-binding protein